MKQETIERRRMQARIRYWQNRLDVDIHMSGAYRGPGNGDTGKDARCPRCDRLYQPMDFRTDPTGCVLEPVACWACAS